MPFEIALFPLNAVLFPGGLLPLRVFESRYVDMVRECMRANRPFGVCLITRGTEVGQPAEHEAVGCLARIIDFDAEQPGVLRIRAIGGRRFRIAYRRAAPGGLARATVDELPDDPAREIPPELRDCARLARLMVADLERRVATDGQPMIAEPHDFGSAAWVSNRLCEFLPIPLRAKQKLMELDDPLARLSLVQQFLRQRRAI